MNFDVDLNKTQRDALLLRRTNLLAKTAGVTWTTTQLDNMRDLVADLATLLLDDAQLSAADREYSRSLDVDGHPVAPEYRHEFLVRNDQTYQAAWAYDHTEGQNIDFKALADAEPNLYSLVLLGQTNYTYRENDPDIVDRSLLRNGYRLPREGETQPPPVVGRYAPKFTVVMPSAVNESVVPEMTVTY